MNTSRVIWTAVDTTGKIHEGELMPRPLGTKYADIETEFFPIVNDFNAARFRVLWPDGSGHISCYEKRGEIWLKTYSDNIMPTNFGYFFLACIFVVPAAVFLICLFLGK